MGTQSTWESGTGLFKSWSLVTMSTMDTLDTLVEAARGWYLFPPTEEQKRQEKFLLLSDNGSTQDNLFSLNWIGLMIALIIILFLLQMAMPGIRQMGDFVSAVYSPYGGDEYLTNRYDTFYGDYDDSGKFSRQYRNFDEAKSLLTDIVKVQNSASSQDINHSLIAPPQQSASGQNVPLIN